jgi:hypothetical protein
MGITTACPHGCASASFSEGVLGDSTVILGSSAPYAGFNTQHASTNVALAERVIEGAKSATAL